MKDLASLYRAVLRAHKPLPAPMRILGDRYAWEEFRLHREKASPDQLETFLSAWSAYLNHLHGGQQRAPKDSLGADLTLEQRQQYNRLKEEATRNNKRQ